MKETRLNIYVYDFSLEGTTVIRERASILEHVQCNVGIFQTSCKWSPYPFLILVAYQKKSEVHFVVVVLNLMFMYYHKKLSLLMHYFGI